MQEYIFRSEVVDSTRYKKLKGIRFVLYWILLVIVGINIRPRTRFSNFSHPSVAEQLELDFGMMVLIFAILGIVAIGIYEYSTTMPLLGQIEFTDGSIEIKLNGKDKNIYYYDEVQNLTIRRRSSWQHENREKNYLKKFGSVVQLVDEGKHHEYEFMINTQEHNGQFEEMINILRAKPVNFLFTSV